MWLLIDDVRDLSTEAIARTPAAAKKLLAAGGWEYLFLDHDLAAEGYDILVWALKRNLVPSRVQLVPSDSVGRKNMRAALEAAGYFMCDGVNFIKAGGSGARLSAPANHHTGARVARGDLYAEE